MDEYMRHAFRLAKKASPHPNPRVGAVLVRSGKIIGSGWHKAAGKPHAEVEAIEDAKRRNGNPHAARGATLYVTLEPCSHTAKRTPPCTRAIIREGIAKVVYAMNDPNPLAGGAGAKELALAGINVAGPTNPKDAAAINRRYIGLISKKPFAAIKMAMSADGKTATRTGDSRWISGPESRALVHRMRGDFDAVMVGAGTVEKDDPELTTHGLGRNPYRIIIDGRLHIGIDSRVVRNRDGLTIVVACEKAERAKALAIQRNGARVLVCGRDSVDLKKLMIALGAMGIKRILIEGGSELNALAMKAGIVDRLYLFIAPKIIGGRGAKPVIGGFGIGRMENAVALSKPRVRKIGKDVLLEYEISA
jgi:diaminohydroxyphosphoribosylaminopyrimidine deaminase / 5-amino-6-(5-phosphoribosylamino)uracil reductase